MRIVLLVLALAAVALFALPSSPVSSAATGTAFAAEMSTSGPVPISDYCSKYCHGNPGGQYCSYSPAERNGCHHISTTGNCIFTLCPPGGGDPNDPKPVPDPEVVE